MSMSAQSLGRVLVFVTTWTVAHQVPLSMEFPKQEYWSELPFPTPGHLSNPGIKPTSPALAGGFFTTKPPGKPSHLGHNCIKVRIAKVRLLVKRTMNHSNKLMV